MATFSLSAVGATAGVAVGPGTYSVNVSGTFTATVLFERAAAPGAPWRPLARDNAGNLLSFTAPSGDLVLTGADQEPDALIRASVTAYTSGTVAIRIGRP